MLGGDVTIPKIGSVPKVALVGIGVAAAGFIGWKYWKSRTAAAATDATATDPGFDDSGTLPGVAGAVSDTNSYGATTGDSGTDGTGQILTNAQWSNAAIAALEGSYDPGALAAALGNYLGGQPLSSDQQTMVRAAIAVAGYPPVGSFSIISGGNTALTVAPTGVHVTSVSATTAVVAFSPVAGATSYRLYESGVSNNIGSSTSSPITASNLKPSSSYTFHVTAFNAAGTAGPDSASTSTKTAAGAAAGAPKGLRSASTTASEIHLVWSAVSRANGYDITWTDPKGKVGNASSLNPSYVMINLPKSYRYTIRVRTKVTGSATGAWSSPITVTTKSK